MADTSIEWADKSWNPLRGCSRVSAGCQRCYAERMAHRFSGPGRPYEGLTKMTSHGPVWTGVIRLVHDVIDEPLHWKKPARVFVNSMSDLFHEDVPIDFIAMVFAYMAYARQHTFQVLTKRAVRMQQVLSSSAFAASFEGSLSMAHDQACEILGARGEFDPNERRRDDIRAFDPSLPLANAWLGVSVENQETADERIPFLLQTPAAVRWLSCEPLLGPVDIAQWMWPLHWHWAAGYRSPEEAIAAGAYAERKPQALLGAHVPLIKWVVAGGESGPGARPTVIGHVRDIVKQCQAAGVPVFVKQLGAKPTNREGVAHPLKDRKGGDITEFPVDLQVREYPNAAR